MKQAMHHSRARPLSAIIRAFIVVTALCACGPEEQAAPPLPTAPVAPLAPEPPPKSTVTRGEDPGSTPRVQPSTQPAVIEPPGNATLITTEDVGEATSEPRAKRPRTGSEAKDASRAGTKALDANSEAERLLLDAMRKEQERVDRGGKSTLQELLEETSTEGEDVLVPVSRKRKGGP